VPRQSGWSFRSLPLSAKLTVAPLPAAKSLKILAGAVFA
jgi:hypothetical protein